MRYRYRIYGLKVESELEISEAYKECAADRGSVAKADVQVRLADMPQKVKQSIKIDGRTGNMLIKGEDFVFFRIKDVADYLVQTSEIRVSAFCEVTLHPVRTFLLGTAFGIWMIMNNIVALHGGAAGKDKEGIIITGESGAGKSTITNKLLSNGWKFVADDVCALTVSAQGVHINMAYPQQKLCRDAALNMGYRTDDLIYIDENRDKFAVRLKDGYLSEGAAFSQLYEICFSDTEELRITRLDGIEKLQAVTRNIYRREATFDIWGSIPPQYFKNCLEITKNIDVYRVERPRGRDTVEDIMRFIDENTRKNSKTDGGT